MARGQQKIQSQQKNAKKAAEKKKQQGADQKTAAKAALVHTCPVCRTQMPDPKTFKQHFESKHPKSPLPPELADAATSLDHHVALPFENDVVVVIVEEHRDGAELGWGAAGLGDFIWLYQGTRRAAGGLAGTEERHHEGLLGARSPTAHKPHPACRQRPDLVDGDVQSAVSPLPDAQGFVDAEFGSCDSLSLWQGCQVKTELFPVGALLQKVSLLLNC
ncbi:hypothetical protein JZ751_000456 [Albula glossodonta]|uniref:Zinc finger protein 706 n=1 Tax=Albula glossodonta TaxID=121402 RepID=A0A8T2PWF9_9TELE|nr:hypothetical protein JZ751_000456 [Albula glossodonta]